MVRLIQIECCAHIVHQMCKEESRMIESLLLLGLVALASGELTFAALRAQCSPDNALGAPTARASGDVDLYAPVVLLHYTPAMLDALFNGRIDGVEPLCVPAGEPCPPASGDNGDWHAGSEAAALLCRDKGAPREQQQQQQRRRLCGVRPLPPLPGNTTREAAADDGAWWPRLTHVAHSTCARWKSGLPPCVVLHDAHFAAFDAVLQRADAVLLGGANTALHRAQPAAWPQRRFAGQRRVFHDWRSRVNYPAFADPAFMRRFDVTAGYARNYTLWGLDVIGNTQAALRAEPRASERHSDALLAMFVSNCNAKNSRLAFVERLMRALPDGAVHSFGKCLHSAEVPPELRQKNRYQEKRAVLRKYKFALAIENVNDPDYVSEKVWDALAAGAIPVYGGAPNVKDFVPDETAIINIDDFDTPEELAEHLVQVASDPLLYDMHHEWRSWPSVHTKLRYFDQNVRGYFECKVCELIFEERRAIVEKDLVDHQ